MQKLDHDSDNFHTPGIFGGKKEKGNASKIKNLSM